MSFWRRIVRRYYEQTNKTNTEVKIATNIAGALLGLLFVAFSLMILLNLAPPPPPFPEGSAVAHFMAAFATTGYLKFVKVFELMGGLLVAVPKTRRAGLLVLGPIIINILAFHSFITAGNGLLSPVLLVIVALTLFLVWAERAAFRTFLYGNRARENASSAGHEWSQAQACQPAHGL